MWRPPAWTQQARCHGKYEKMDEGRATSALLSMCRQCPVLEDCKADVLTEELGLPAATRSAFRAGMTPTARAQAERRAAVCPACETPGGVCAGCLAHARTMREFGGFVIPLRCIQCGGAVSDNRFTRCTYCTDTSAGRWARKEVTA